MKLMFNEYVDKKNNERVLFRSKPNLVFFCKESFLLLVLLGAITYFSHIAIAYIAEFQVYLVSFVNLPLTTYFTIAIFIVMFAIIIRIVWTLLKWKFTEYIITGFRVILKEGILFKKSYNIPHNHVQDITVSQSIVGKLFSVGDVSIFSAYDGTDMDFENVNKPDEVQELIFNEMNREFHEEHEVGCNECKPQTLSNSYLENSLIPQNHVNSNEFQANDSKMNQRQPLYDSYGYDSNNYYGNNNPRLKNLNQRNRDDDSYYNNNNDYNHDNYNNTNNNYNNNTNEQDEDIHLHDDYKDDQYNPYNQYDDLELKDRRGSLKNSYRYQNAVSSDEESENINRDDDYRAIKNRKAQNIADVYFKKFKKPKK